MSKFPLLPLTLAIAAGLTLSQQAKGQVQTSSYGSAGGPSSDPFGQIGSNPQRGKAPPSTGQSQDPETPDDDTLTRLSTKDSLGAGGMVRDEGQLTAKVLRKEKITNVDTKQLPTTKTDSKFQGSFIDSGVSSIRNVAAKKDAAPAVQNEEDARFKAQQLMFTPSTTEERIKAKESARTKADSSPSPSPSPSASGSPSSR